MTTKRVLTGAIVVAMLVLPAIAAPPDGKSTADRDAGVAEKWIAGWNSHDPDKMLPLFTDDIFYEDVAFGEVSYGRAEVRKFVVAELLKRASVITPNVPEAEVLTGMTIKDVADMEAAARKLVDLANERGGADNITVIVVRIGAESKGWFSWLHPGRKRGTGNGIAGGK